MTTTAPVDRPAQQRVLAQVDPAALVDLASGSFASRASRRRRRRSRGVPGRFFRERGYRVDLQEIEPGRFQTIATLPGTGGGASVTGHPMLSHRGRGS
jgi:hypothetical protein